MSPKHPTIREFLSTTFPSLAPRIEGLQPAEGRFHGGGYVGFASHPELFTSAQLFVPTNLGPPEPESFAAIVILSKGGGEELVVMLVEHRRSFWFRSRYMSLAGSEEVRARTGLDAALSRWDAGERVVVVCL